MPSSCWRLRAAAVTCFPGPRPWGSVSSAVLTETSRAASVASPTPGARPHLRPRVACQAGAECRHQTRLLHRRFPAALRGVSGHAAWTPPGRTGCYTGSSHSCSKCTGVPSGKVSALLSCRDSGSLGAPAPSLGPREQLATGDLDSFPGTTRSRGRGCRPASHPFKGAERGPQTQFMPAVSKGKRKITPMFPWRKPPSMDELKAKD